MINNVAVAKEFYTAMGKKNVEGMETYLHSNVWLRTPFDEVNGKEAYIKSLKKFLPFFDTLLLRTVCGEGSEVMLAYDLGLSERVEKLPVAVLLHFDEGLIDKIELYFDPRAFVEKKEEIYS